MEPLAVVSFIIIYAVELFIGFRIFRAKEEKRKRPKKMVQGRLISTRYVNYRDDGGAQRSYSSAKYTFCINGVQYTKTFDIRTDNPNEFVNILYVDGVKDAVIEGCVYNYDTIAVKVLFCVLFAPIIASALVNVLRWFSVF